MPYASVYPLVSSRAVARPFTYEVPPEVGKGAVVSVRFAGAKRRGVVVGLEESPPEGVKAAPVGDVVDELPEPLVDLALWLAGYYGSTPARALELVAPTKRKARGERPQPAERDSLGGEAEPAQLSESQERALARIVEALDGGGGNVLLHGATGSGKTEVYLQACAAALERGHGAIVLVPEIALAPQTVGRLRARFGDRVAVLHSSLTEAERRDERVRIASGAAPIVVGARSAVFAPVTSLGVICVDEEHDPSYKQEADPRYDARTVAAKRAALEGAVAIFGTATPRPESWERLERLELGGRLAGLPRSASSTSAGRPAIRSRRRSLPSSAPWSRTEARRSCSSTAAVSLRPSTAAPAGDPPLSQLRRRARSPRRRSAPLPPLLSRRGDGGGLPRVRLARARADRRGTQRLEQELAEKVPGLERIRLDADAIRRPAELTAALRRFAETDRAVLVGTQMVAKGHHFAGVALAAVVDADTGLGMPDFRAEERTFQLVTQLAGRSGRDAPGRVVVQTFQPDSRPIVHAARHDVTRFLAEELERRRELGYPPFRHLVRVVADGREAGDAMQLLGEIGAGLGGDVLGPAPLLRLRGRHRAQLLVKTDRVRPVASRAAQLLAAAAPAMSRAGCGRPSTSTPKGCRARSSPAAGDEPRPEASPLIT